MHSFTFLPAMRFSEHGGAGVAAGLGFEGDADAAAEGALVGHFRRVFARPRGRV
jgi:hypothetical protein